MMSWSTRLLMAQAAVLSIIAGAACNRRHPPADNDLTPGPSSVVMPAPVPIPTSTLSAVTVRPQAVVGGNSGRGSALLTLPAPPGGISVTLSTSDPAVSIPPSVNVDAGRDSADFPFTTSAVGDDHPALVVGTIPGRTVTTSVVLWSMVPTFFSFASDPGDFVGSGGVRRFFAPSSRFTASCERNHVEIRIEDSQLREFWSANFSGPPNVPLRIGTYVAERWPFARGAGMDIGGAGRGCNTLSGQFSVREADYGPNGTVRRFWASFEQHCGNGSPALVGDVRVTNVPAIYSSPITCLVP